MTPDLAIVIPVYGNWWMTARALRALAALRSGVSFETIVVDNASPDETPRAIAEFPWARYERMKRNHNFAGACNAGARLSDAPVVLFLNNDAYPLGDALVPLVRAFDRGNVAIAGGELLFEDGAVQSAGFVVLPNAHWHYSCRNLPADLEDVTHGRDALGVSGAAMAVRKDWFLGSGGFDESYVNGFEDVDLCMRAREAGAAIAYVPGARFAHYEGATAGRFDREAENERRFYASWGPAFAEVPRTERGSVGAIVVRAGAAASPLAMQGLADLETALRSFGHPVVRDAPRWFDRFDRRFRARGSLDWFAAAPSDPGVALERGPDKLPALHVRGGTELVVPWLPCAAYERVERLPWRASDRAGCAAIGVAGLAALSAGRRAEMDAQLDSLQARRPELRVVDIDLQHDASPSELACVLQAELTDESAFGNVLLAQAGFATVVVENSLPALLLARDVVLVAAPGAIASCLERTIDDVEKRMRLARHSGADARRRFSPRRTAIRVVDLLCASRFGLERPAPARANSPV